MVVSFVQTDREETYQNPVNLGEELNLMRYENDRLVLERRHDTILQRQSGCHVHENDL